MTQMQIKGTEPNISPEVNAEIEQLRIFNLEVKEATRKRDAQRDRVQSFLVGLAPPDKQAAIQRAIAVGPAVYHYTDDQGEEVEASAELEFKIRVRKTGAAETPIGEGVEADADASDDDDNDKPARKRGANGVHPGLMAAAERDGNVEVSEDGDVVVPEKSAKKTKAKSKARRKR